MPMIRSAKLSGNSLPKIQNRDAQLVVCENLAGANAKVAKLAQLEKLAKHDLILVSDADVRVPPDFLANVVAPLRDEKIGLVNCFYRLANPSTTAMHWEAVAINADFWSQVLQSQTLKPLDFALGAAMLVRRESARRNRRFPSRWPIVWRTIINSAIASPKTAIASRFVPSWWNAGTRR